MSDHNARRFTEEDRKMAMAVQLTAAREAVIAAAREWHESGQGHNARMWIVVEEALNDAVAHLNRLEATDAK